MINNELKHLGATVAAISLLISLIGVLVAHEMEQSREISELKSKQQIMYEAIWDQGRQIENLYGVPE